jgi:hypothetical protein
MEFMEYLINPVEVVNPLDLCIGHCDCQGVYTDACGVRDVCGVKCTELCGGQFCAPARMDPMSNK